MCFLDIDEFYTVGVINIITLYPIEIDVDRNVYFANAFSILFGYVV